MAAAHAAAPDDALGLKDGRFNPFPCVPSLVECAVMAGRPGETSRGHDISVVPQDRAVWLRPCVGEKVGQIRTGIARCRKLWRGIAPSRVSPVVFSRSARGLRLVIGCLVPFILVGNPDGGAGLTIRETAMCDHLISPRFSVTLTAAMMEPVGKPHRIEKGHMHDRFPLAE